MSEFATTFDGSEEMFRFLRNNSPTPWVSMYSLYEEYKKAPKADSKLRDISDFYISLSNSGLVKMVDPKYHNDGGTWNIEDCLVCYSPRYHQHIVKSPPPTPPSQDQEDSDDETEEEHKYDVNSIVEQFTLLQQLKQAMEHLPNEIIISYIKNDNDIVVNSDDINDIFENIRNIIRKYTTEQKNELINNTLFNTFSFPNAPRPLMTSFIRNLIQNDSRFHVDGDTVMMVAVKPDE